MPLPALRHLDISPVQHEGQTLISLRDPEGITEEAVVLTPVAFFVASLLDGTNEVTDVQYHVFNHSGGRVLSEEDIQGVVDYLDERGYLLTEAFETMHREIVDGFAASDTRQMRHAGRSYPADPDELRSFLDGLFVNEGGPGEKPEPPGDLAPVRGLVAPHIDFPRGNASYAHAYLRLAKGPVPETVLVFGVAQWGAPAPFVLTRKNFETPFGVLETDRELVETLAGTCSWDPFEHELVHRTEHSIDFQTTMLAYLYGSNVRIVPVLCGAVSDGEFPAGPEDLRALDGFLNACRNWVGESDGRVTVVAGADLAHVGHTFGDDFDIDDEVIGKVRERDTEDLEQVVAIKPDDWYRSVMRDGNARRVCGLNCIYATLKAVEGSASAGELLHYGYAPDPAGGIVSFAAIALT